MDGIGQKRFSGVWTDFAKGLYDWARYSYENVGEIAVDEESDTPRSAFHLEYELDNLLNEKMPDINVFYKRVASALTKVVMILPRILMSDKPDMRYEQIVREYCEEHPDVLLRTWIEVRNHRKKFGFMDFDKNTKIRILPMKSPMQTPQHYYAVDPKPFI